MKVKRKVLNKFQVYFNNLKYEAWVGVINYHNTKEEWPTTQELADFLDIDRDSIQPRTSELFESQALDKGSKRPCKSPNTDHGISVTTWKIPDFYMEDVPQQSNSGPIETSGADSEDVIFG